jgi:hypothetical protein
MAKKKAITKKKTVLTKKEADKKTTTVSEPDNFVIAVDEMDDIEINADEIVAAAADVLPDDEEAIPVVIMEQDLVIELCGPGKRCRQRVDGKFIRQNFIAGRWQQVSGTVFSTLEACKTACGG